MTQIINKPNEENKPTKKHSSGIQVIARAASILRALESEKNGLSLGQIAQRVDLPRSTVQRIVNALADENLLIAATLNARVKLGPAILRLAANTNFDFAAYVRPHLELLAQSTGETVDLSMQRGDKMVFVDQISANHRLSALSAVGESFYMHSSANGKAALSQLTDEEIQHLFAKGLAQETPNTLPNVAALLKEVKKIRKAEFAVDNEEHTLGISAIGTAFRDPLGRIFAVSVPVPTIRFTKAEKSIVDALVDFRRELISSFSD